MNWVKQNKFLAVWIAVVVVGAGALGYLVTSAMARHAEVADAYEQQANELNRMERLQPYPNAKSLKALEDQRKAFEARIDELQKTLAKVELPVEPMTPEQFQDRLKKTNDTFKAKAAGANLKLPEKFYMGFDRYETEPPVRDAAGPLGRQLKAIEIVLNQAVDAKVAELRGLTREELPEEKGDRAKAGAETTTGPGGRGKGDKPERERVQKYPFDLVVFSDPQPLRNLLNSIVNAKEQFFIVRNLVVKNEKEKGPPRVDPNMAQGGAAAPTAPSAGAAAPPAAAARPLTFIVGEEKLETALRLEIADFAEVGVAAAK